MLSLLYFLTSTHSEKSNPSRSNGSKVKKFGGPVGGGHNFNTSKFYLFFILTYPENFMCLSHVVKHLTLAAPFWGNPPFWYPQTLVKFYLSFIFPYLKHFMCPG